MYKYLEISSIFPSIINVKCTPADRQ